MKHLHAFLLLVPLVGCDGPDDSLPPVPPEDLVLPPGTTFSVRGAWEDPLELTYRIEPEGGALPEDEFRAAATRALELWAATGVVAFREAAPDRVPSFTIGWGFRRGATIDDGIAQAGPVEAGSFCALDPLAPWGADARHVPATALAHEIGHLLGLDHNDDPRSLLFAEARPRALELGALDRAAIASLYGGGDAVRPGDVVLLGRDGPRGFPLRGVAPVGETEWIVTDLEGDGADDVLVWTTDATYHGATRAFRFARGPRLGQTRGPLFALVGRGRVRADVALTGERVLVTYGEGERYRLCVLDDRGRPVQAGLVPPVELVSGMLDEDGDGVFERGPDPPPEPEPLPGATRVEEGWRVDVAGAALVVDRLVPCDLDGDLETEWVGRVVAVD